MPARGNISNVVERPGESFGISEEAIVIYTWAVYSVICQAINIFGIVTNLINIVCFVKQGFDDSINISLLGLSFSDLGSLVTMMWTSICLTPAVVTADLPFDSVEISYLTTAMPHFTFTRVTSCITALITLERCLCITAPLKIKRIMTSKRTAAINIFIFIAIFSGATPVYVVNQLGMKFAPSRNKTIFGLVTTEYRGNVEKVSFIINNFSNPAGSFIIIITCTTILSYKLRRATEWRQTSSSIKQNDRVSIRNKKVAKMIVMISILFIVCLIPMSITMMVIGCLPQMSSKGKYLNITILISGLGYVMEGINSSMNIFIYYRMSSKYRKNYNKYFSCRTQQKDTIKQKNNNLVREICHLGIYRVH